jgi:LmbE family N-acetylglucosaminyl deacetylase
MYGDPDELDRLARRLSVRAADVRRHADDHVRQGQAAHWVSSSAQAYRDRVARDRVAADRVAAELEQAAAALRAHAQQVRETVATIARFEREATEWFEHQSRSVLHRAEGAVDTAGRLVKHLVADAPWSTWPIGPHNLPSPGDMKWLDVGRFMRGKGLL